jgi:hypothetical protein
MSKQQKDVICKGRMPNRDLCGQVLYQSDGEYMFILGLTLNPGIKSQRIKCDKCGYVMNWKQNFKHQD